MMIIVSGTSTMRDPREDVYQFGSVGSPDNYN